MRKLVAVGLAIGLVGSALVVPAYAGKKAKPVKTTLYLHGNVPVGEGGEAAYSIVEGMNMRMDAEAPTDVVPKSYHFTNPIGNDQCSGNSSFFPTWTGDLSGTIVGSPKWNVHFASPPSSVIARIWTDTPISSCNENYIEPAAEVTVDIPAGHNVVEIEFPKMKLKAHVSVMVELLQRSATQHGRVLYDAVDHDSSLTFDCIPQSGKSCV